PQPWIQNMVPDVIPLLKEAIIPCGGGNAAVFQENTANAVSSWLSGVLDPGNPAGVRCARAIAPRKEIATKIHITGAGTAALEQCGYPLHGIPFACATQIEQYTGLAQGNGLLFPIHIDPAARYLIHLLPQLFRRGTSGRCSAEVPQVTD